MSTDDRLDRAEARYRDGDLRAAIIEAKDVLLDEPDSVRGRVLLGRVSVAVGDGASAEKELEKAIELGATRQEVAPELARALLLQGKFEKILKAIPLDSAVTGEADTAIRNAHGDAYLGLAQPARAREMYTSALERRPDNLAAQLGVATSYFAERNVLQAQAAIEHMLESNPEATRAWLYSGAFNVQTRNFEAAEANYRVALDLAAAQDDQQSRLAALAGLATSLFELGMPDAGGQFVDQLGTYAPQAIETKLLKARKAVASKDWFGAQQHLLQVLKESPEYRPAQLILGSVHMESGNLAQAEMYLSAAVAAHPGDATARQLLAATQLQMRKAYDAQQALAPIVDRPDADLASLQLAVQASMGRRDVEGALGYLDRSIADHPHNIDLQFQLAAVLIEAGRSAEAKDVLDGVDVSGSSDTAYMRDALRVLNSLREGHVAEARQAALDLADQHSDRHGALNLLGTIHLAGGNLEAARENFEKARVLEPGDLVSQRYLASMDASQGDLDAAETRYRHIVAERPGVAWAVFALGRIAFSREDYDSAASYFRQALEAESGNNEYRLALARAERRMGDIASAEETLGNDAEASLDHIPTAVMLGTLKAERGDIAGALNMAQQLQRRHPKDPAPFAFEAEIHLIAKNLSKADISYDNALELGMARNHVLRSYQVKRQLGVSGAEQPLLAYLEQRPLDNTVRAVLAEHFVTTNDPGKSISAYERILSEQPKDAVALNNLAWSYYLVGDPRAIDTARRAHVELPGNGAIADTLGWILVENGELEEGERLLRQAVALENGSAEIRYHLAVALSRLGRSDEARRTLQEILARGDAFASQSDAEKLLAEL